MRLECECGRRSIIDFSMGYSEAELVQMLNALDTQRDAISKAIETARQRKPLGIHKAA